MKKEKWIQLRITAEKRALFKKKATEEYGGMGPFLEQQIDAFLAREPIANDAELTALLYAVKSLRSYTNNIDQIAEKLNSGKQECIDEEMVQQVRLEVVKVIEKFKQCLATRKDCFE